MTKKTRTIYQKEFIDSICDKSNLTKTKARKLLSAIKLSIKEALRDRESVTLKSFGTFSIKKQSSRRFFHIKHGEFVDYPAKNVIKFKKSNTWQLPMPKSKKVRAEKSATRLHKKNVSYSLRRNQLECDKELIDFYRELIEGKLSSLPYIWKLNIRNETYNDLKGLLSWGLEEYDDSGIDSSIFLKKHANIMAIYIGEWYKREYSNERGDESNDALRSLGLSGSTLEYNIVWEYSSSAFNIERFLYQTKMTNRTKHSLYVLGGIPLQFESKKLRAIIFNTLNKETEKQQNESETEDERSEDEAFLIDNIYLRESLIREDGSLHLFVNELKNGAYIEELKESEDYKQFIQTYQDLQQTYFCKYKLRSEWIVYYRKGCGIVDRILRIHLRNEFSNESDPMYISDYRLKKWNIPMDELDDFDIVLKMNNGITKRLFHFTYTNDNCYTCSNRSDNKTIDEIPHNFETATFYLRSNDTGEEYEIPEKTIVFNDVIRLFKTANEYEWTDSSYINSTEATMLCSNQYEPIEQDVAETLYLGSGEERKTYYWIPFENSITIRHIETGDETIYTSKVGRISIRLKHHRMGTLHKTVPMMEIEKKTPDGSIRKVPIFRKNPERYDKDRFFFEEYDQQQGMLKSKYLDRESDVTITILQNGKELSYPLGLSSLSYGLFTVRCCKQNHSCSFEAFCIESSDDIVRNFEDKTYRFSSALYKTMNGMYSLNPQIHEIAPYCFKEDLNVESGKDVMLFSSQDGNIRIPVFRVADKAYVAFIKGAPKVVAHNSNSRTPILYIPKSQQADITRINVIDKDGVRGIDISEVTFRNSQLVEVCYNGADGYRLIISDYDKNEYKFISYSTETEYIEKVTPTHIGNSTYHIKCKKGNIILQFIDYSNEPNYIFRFVSATPNSGMQWLLGIGEKEEIANKRLPSFLYAYYWYKFFNFSKNDYDFLIHIADELHIDWMFLFPKIWKSMAEKDDNMRNVLYNLFISRKPNDEYIQAIANGILNGISDHALWVDHRIDKNKEHIGYKAVELLMPIHVQKSRKRTSVKHVNTKNADKVREVDMDKRNITVVREYSLTGCLRDEKFVDEFLYALNEEDAYEEIYDYMKQYKLL